MAVFEQHTTLSRQYPLPYTPVFDTAWQTIQRLGHQLGPADPYHGVIQFSTGVSLTTWGENITVQIAPVDPQQSATVVQLTSSGALPTLVGQGRRNRKVINQFFEELDKALAVPGWPAQG